MRLVVRHSRGMIGTRVEGVSRALGLGPWVLCPAHVPTFQWLYACALHVGRHVRYFLSFLASTRQEVETRSEMEA